MMCTGDIAGRRIPVAWDALAVDTADLLPPSLISKCGLEAHLA